MALAHLTPANAVHPIKLEVKDLNFYYGKFHALKHVNLAIQKNKVTAFIGPSGCGKSTLLRTFNRMFELYPGQRAEGQILLDGVEIEDFKLVNLRRHIALVTQQVTLFNDSVLRNIAYGDLADASLEQVKSAAEAAYAAEFIERLPEGYQTAVGENGVLLSGGQRQRLAIARALLKNAPLLILDEATSALDAESERHIQAALERLMHGRTTLVIAHRLSTIEKADLILVMEQGRIVERGKHAELLAQGGLYASLHARQFADEEPAVC